MPLTENTLNAFKKGNVFVETGTFMGDGINNALKAGFQKIYSIEVAQQYIKLTSERFRKEIEEGIVNIIFGDSKLVMGDVIKNIDEPITFWLDAHWDYGPGKGEVYCPLYEELTFIKNHKLKDHLILIDDMRVIGNASHHWGKTVQRDRIIELINEINQDYKISYTEGDLGPDEGGLRANDILVASV